VRAPLPSLAALPRAYPFTQHSSLRCYARPGRQPAAHRAPGAPASAASFVLAPPELAPPGQAEATGEKFHYEALFRSAHKLLMDSATSEYLFCHDFWAGDQAIFHEVFAPAVAAVEENLAQFLANCVDMSGIILMVRAHLRCTCCHSAARSYVRPAGTDSHQPRAPSHYVAPPRPVPRRLPGQGAPGSVCQFSRLSDIQTLRASRRST